MRRVFSDGSEEFFSQACGPKSADHYLQRLVAGQFRALKFRLHTGGLVIARRRVRA